MIHLRKKLNSLLFFLLLFTLTIFANESNCRYNKNELKVALEYISNKIIMATIALDKKEKIYMKIRDRKIKIDYNKIISLVSEKEFSAILWITKQENDEIFLGKERNKFIRYLTWQMLIKKECGLDTNAEMKGLELFNYGIYGSYWKTYLQIDKEKKEKIRKLLGNKPFNMVNILNEYKNYIKKRN